MKNIDGTSILISAVISLSVIIYSLYHLYNISKNSSNISDNSDKILKKLNQLTGESTVNIPTKNCVKCGKEFKPENILHEYCNECNKKKYDEKFKY